MDTKPLAFLFLALFFLSAAPFVIAQGGLGSPISGQLQESPSSEVPSDLVESASTEQEEALYDGYIVEFQEEPLVITQKALEEEAEQNKDDTLKRALAAVLPISLEPTLPENLDEKIQLEKEALEEEHEEAKQDILEALGKETIVSGITGNVVGEPSQDELVVKGEYNLAFNGLALDISDEEARHIERLENVRRVTPNYIVHAFLNESVPLTHANETWQLNSRGESCSGNPESCLTGRGVRIGVLDTGVDYSHPDLCDRPYTRNYIEWTHFFDVDFGNNVLYSLFSNPFGGSFNRISKIQVIELETSEINRIIPINLNFPSDFSVDFEDRQAFLFHEVYFDTNATMYINLSRIDLGTNEQQTYVQFTRTRIPYMHLDIDRIANKLLWSVNNSIYRSNYDGTNQERVIEAQNPILNFAWNPQNRIFYLSHSGGIRIVSESGQLINSIDGVAYYNLVYDSIQNKIFWVTADFSLRRANFDGSDTRTILQLPRQVGEYTLYEPYSIYNNMLYHLNDNLTSRQIFRIDLGTLSQSLVLEKNNNPPYNFDCKVISGFDFVNNDIFPYDDNGHGTHVISTIAGDGNVKGVAPNAQIFAYKVLNGRGSGENSNILSAIERSLDPNQDGDFSDHLDIISLSLGIGCRGIFGQFDSRCGPDDPLSRQIDNAVNTGIIAVIAAGNDGSLGIGTIGSPGTARKAITVGAIYKEFNSSSNRYDIAPFSSIGPVEWESNNQRLRLSKPDIVTFGVNICSSKSLGFNPFHPLFPCKDSNHALMDGTSMATPHVTGAVALIKQAHPKWTPIQVKNFIKDTAVDLGYDVNTQGAGMLNLTGFITYLQDPSAQPPSTEEPTPGQPAQPPVQQPPEQTPPKQQPPQQPPQSPQLGGWLVTGDDIYTNSKVGIRNSNPQGTLDIRAHTNDWDGGITLTSANGQNIFKIHPDNDPNYGLMFQGRAYFDQGVKINRETVREPSSGKGIGSGTTDSNPALDVRAPLGQFDPVLATFTSDQHGLGIRILSHPTFSEISTNNLNYPIILNPNGGNVGIGAARANEELVVTGNSEDARISLYRSSDTETDHVQLGYDSVGSYIYERNPRNPFRIWTGGTEQLRVMPNGRIGLGVEDPSQKLTVNGNILATGTLMVNRIQEEQGRDISIGFGGSNKLDLGQIVTVYGDKDMKIEVGKLIMTNTRGQCFACGPDENGAWACTSVSCTR